MTKPITPDRCFIAGRAMLLVCLLLVPALALAQADSFERDRMKTLLNNVSKEIEKNFYDPQLKGLNWKELTEQAKQKIEVAKTPSEMVTAIFGLVDKLKDSHTFFIPPMRAVRPLFGFEAQAFGDEIRIYKLKKGGASIAAGLQLGDRVLGINGFRVDRNNIDLLTLYFRVLRPMGTLQLLIARGDEPPRTIEVQAKLKQEPIVADLTTLESIYTLLQEAEEDEPYAEAGEHEGGIGYAHLRTFVIEAEHTDNIASMLKKSRAFVIDLRGNTGGVIDTMAAMAGHFDAQPTTLADEVGRKKTEPIKVKPRRPALEGPLFILVDSRSMSASEMFARHLQRTGRAKVIGDRTPGNVNAARVLSLQYGGDRVIPYGVEVSVGRVVFPGGEELEGKGVTPDHVCIPTAEDLRAERDPCRDLAVNLARKALGLPEQAAEKKPDK